MTEVDWLLDQFAADPRRARRGDRRARAAHGCAAPTGREPPARATTAPTPARRTTTAATPADGDRRSPAMPELVETDRRRRAAGAGLGGAHRLGARRASGCSPPTCATVDGPAQGVRRPAGRAHRPAAAGRPARRRPRHDGHHEVGAAAAGRGAAHRPGDPRARHLRDRAARASSRRSSGPSSSTCRCGTWASRLAPGPAMRAGVRRSLRRFAAVAAAGGRLSRPGRVVGHDGP